VSDAQCRWMRDRVRTIHHLPAPASYREVVPQRSEKKRISTAVRLPVELHTELQRQAEARDVSVNFLVTRAVDHYLRRLEVPDPLAATGNQDGVLT
jgi:predicted HicB family RNase H-like nuclease